MYFVSQRDLGGKWSKWKNEVITVLLKNSRLQKTWSWIPTKNQRYCGAWSEALKIIMQMLVWILRPVLGDSLVNRWKIKMKVLWASQWGKIIIYIYLALNISNLYVHSIMQKVALISDAWKERLCHISRASVAIEQVGVRLEGLDEGIIGNSKKSKGMRPFYLGLMKVTHT